MTRPTLGGFGTNQEPSELVGVHGTGCHGVFDGHSSIRQNIHGAGSVSASLWARRWCSRLSDVFQAKRVVLMRRLRPDDDLSMVRLLTVVPIFFFFSFFLLWQSRTAPTSSSSPQERTL